MDYKLARSRRKTLALYIKSDGSLEVRAPLLFPKPEIDKFVRSKEKWISKKLAERPRPALRLENAYGAGEFDLLTYRYFDKWTKKLGVSATFAGYRKMSTRWGSCTVKTRRIRLSSALEYFPPECLEYVIVHELAHLLEPNHSPRFWKIVGAAIPDYKELKIRLNKNRI
jgi:Predicted metal-dependent hydrolase